MKREDEFNEYKKTTGELNEGMISISSILNKHKKGTLYFGLKNDGTPFRFTITDSTIRDVSRKVFEAIKPQIFPTVTTVDIEGDPFNGYWYVCEKCHGAVNWKEAVCPHCGWRLDWNG